METKEKNNIKEKIEKMIQTRHGFTLQSHYEFLNVRQSPVIGFIDQIGVKSARMKNYQSFHVCLKKLADKAGAGQEEIKNCLVDMFKEKQASQDDGTAQIILNVLYEFGISMGEEADKNARNKDFALNPKKVAKIWRGNSKIANKNDVRSK